jgi:hypothetical protein
LWYIISHTLRQPQRTLISKRSLIQEVQEANPVPEEFAEAFVTKRETILSSYCSLLGYNTVVW